MNDLGTRTIETDRLILRKFCIEDAEQMFYGWASDLSVSRFLFWEPHKDIDETRNILEGWIQKYKKNSYNWAVQSKDTGKLIGSICCANMNKYDHNCEVGYCYGSKYWGQGYATEALKAVIDYLFNECNLHVIESLHHEKNIASGIVMSKAGMTKECVLKDRKYNPDTKTYSDLILYSIINPNNIKF